MAKQLLAEEEFYWKVIRKLLFDLVIQIEFNYTKFESFHQDFYLLNDNKKFSLRKVIVFIEIIDQIHFNLKLLKIKIYNLKRKIKKYVKLQIK